MFEAQSAVVEVNRLCMPVMVCHEDDRETSMTVKQKCERLRELSRAPITCLVGTMESLSEEISHLPLLQRHSSLVQISSDNTKGHLESAANEEREKPHTIPWSISCKSNMATEKKMEDIPKMVELYQCPQFGDVPVTLPHNTAYRAIVTRVIQAQRHLVHKAVFHNILSSSTMERFVINSFWWLFLENFQPDRKAQDRLFGRIAENYISILTQSSLSSNSGTIFLPVNYTTLDFPSILSQMLFCCFSCCFPQSCCFRDPAFLTALCSTAYQWIGGLCPAPEVYKQWDFEALEANETSSILQREKKEESDSSLTSIDSVFSCIFFSEPSGSLTAVKKKRMKSPCEVSQAIALYSKNKLTTTSHTSTSEVEKAASQNIPGSDLKALTEHRNHTSARESHAVDGHIEVKQCVFNVWGNSPLVQHYMNTLRLQRNVGYNVLVRRTQIRALPQADSLTYRDVLRQTACQRRELRSLWARHRQEISSMQQKREDEQNQLLRKHKKILSQRNVVHKLCQLLVPPAKGEEESKIRSEQLLAFSTIITGIE
ncbi:protein FAM227A isoform X2 [Pangasianodon hypophthalmus]|uniref:protein FAM227A isoform X2 n=1 Tax=Pangasianodon hypophthalmus TaxID=310915 RepID=UPI000F000048|nr:protein FAM227A isoform X2 [Pangasianodon hypophthalmus]